MPMIWKIEMFKYFKKILVDCNIKNFWEEEEEEVV